MHACMHACIRVPSMVCSCVVQHPQLCCSNWDITTWTNVCKWSRSRAFCLDENNCKWVFPSGAFEHNNTSASVLFCPGKILVASRPISAHFILLLSLYPSGGGGWISWPLFLFASLVCGAIDNRWLRAQKLKRFWYGFILFTFKSSFADPLTLNLQAKIGAGSFIERLSRKY